MVVDVLVATCMSNLLRFLASINVSGLVGNTMRLVLLAIVVFFFAVGLVDFVCFQNISYATPERKHTKSIFAQNLSTFSYKSSDF